MGKNKLRKFAEMENIPLVLQYPYRVVLGEGFPYKGRWRDFFGNDNPIILELGCGKGEYTVGLARRFPDRNFVGIDIKGARMHSGATAAQAEGLTNVAFLRTSIELLEAFFAPGEVSGIWITFPDPQMRKVNKRLTGTRFVEMYRRVLRPDAVVNLKTDSPFLFAYTTMMAEHNGLEIVQSDEDIDRSGARAASPVLSILTHYEKQWMDRGLPIRLFAFRPGTSPALAEPPEAVDIPVDTYRSYSRGYIQMPDLMEAADSSSEND